MKINDWVELARIQGQLSGMSEAIIWSEGDVRWKQLAEDLQEMSETINRIREDNKSRFKL